MDSKQIDPVMLKALQVMQEQEKLEQQIRSAFFGLDLTKIQEIIRWQETFGQMTEAADIVDLVDNLSGEEPDFDKAEDWLESNRNELTAEKLRNIVYAAMLQGVSNCMRKVSLERHAENHQLAKNIISIWASGKYSSRDVCAEQEYSGLGFGSFKAARNALINTPDPSPWPGKDAKKNSK